MRIYFNGDSNVAGEELSDPSQSMAGVISRYYDAEMINQSQSGACNDRIYDTTFEFIKKESAPDLIIIGWTEHGREQWWLDGSFHQINQLDVGDRVPESMRRRHQLWKHYVKHDKDWHRVMGIYWHNKIYNLHTVLKEQQIPHLFFNTFFHFHIGKNEHLDWSGAFYRPYWPNCTYMNWCIEHGFEEITPGWQHYPATAHESWANEMIRIINTDQLLTLGR